MIAAIMGVCGCGKTTVGTRLADRLGWRFFDADDFHPPENVSKMASGIALTDDDRWPWLDRLAAALDDSTRAGVHVVLACSALKQAYRERLTHTDSNLRDVRWIYLKGDTASIAPRLAARSGHYMPPTLLASQFAVLEEPTNALVIDIGLSTDEQVAVVVRELTGDRAAGAGAGLIVSDSA